MDIKFSFDYAKCQLISLWLSIYYLESCGVGNEKQIICHIYPKFGYHILESLFYERLLNNNLYFLFFLLAILMASKTTVQAIIKQRNSLSLHFG